MRAFLFCCWLLLMSASAFAEKVQRSDGEKKVYFVNDYAYDAAGSGGDPDNGHILCASRCNALSFDYLDYTMAGSWEVVKIGSDRQITVPLDNPFLGGQCICSVDEYLVRLNNRNLPEKPAGQ